MKPRQLYFLGAGSWFLAYGIQTVTFAWLVTMVLKESPALVGIAQMAFLAPAMILMLVGGSLADHYGGRIVAICGQAGAAMAPLFLTAMMYLDQFTYASLIVFAVMMGCAQALVTPARDGLLALVADGKIQRRVVHVSMIQFGVQMLGFLIASSADRIGPQVILLIQFASLTMGTLAYYKMKLIHKTAISTTNLASQIFTSIREGYRTVRGSPAMSAVVIQNCAMGLFFMGSYLVTLPLLVRELYQGSSAELSWMNAANSLGLVITIMVLLRFGDLHRQGRALILAHLIGCFALAGAGLGLGFTSLIVSVFFWGTCGGVAMTMSRTIMQEPAPPDQRSRMMAFYSFSFMGSGPLGALFSGLMANWLGPQVALITSATLMLLVISAVAIKSSLWRMDAGYANPTQLAVDRGKRSMREATS